VRQRPLGADRAAAGEGVPQTGGERVRAVEERDRELVRLRAMTAAPSVMEKCEKYRILTGEKSRTASSPFSAILRRSFSTFMPVFFLFCSI
jgi:hypothetical protein